MRAVIQRVSQASVAVNGREVGSIAGGMLVLLGIEKNDEDSDIALLCRKLLSLRIFSDSAGKLNLSIQDINGAILVISQFTLYGDCRKGNRPSFSQAAPPEQARLLYDRFLSTIQRGGVHVETGEFQAMMEVSLVNDGPVTLIVDTRPR
jgi:D-tyrosyl-tRNA(Tyr) deacylase